MSSSKDRVAEPSTVIDGNPIINAAFREPDRFWSFSGVAP